MSKRIPKLGDIIEYNRDRILALCISEEYETERRKCIDVLVLVSEAGLNKWKKGNVNWVVTNPNNWGPSRWEVIG